MFVLSESVYLCGQKEEVDDFKSEKSFAQRTFCKPVVRTAYLLDDAEKLLDATPRQTILKYAKAMSKQDCNVDHYDAEKLMSCVIFSF